MSEKLGTESIEKAMDLASKNIALGIKIGKDGVNEADIAHLPEAFANIKELVEFVASKPSLAAEFKDIDLSEGVKLLQKAYDEYKEVKDAV